MTSMMWRAISVVSLAGGGFLLATGRGDISSGVLLLIVGLASSGVLLGGGRYGPSSEGVNDLSARLGLGLLGGVLGALAILVVRAVLEGFGIPDAVGVELTPVWTGSAFLGHLGAATLWGMVLGVVFPYFPGVSPGSTGLRFSLVISAYMFVRGYPLDLDLGWFGLDLGVFAWVFVVGLNMVWGLVTGAVIGWGEESDEAPVARPIDAPAAGG
ncbi:MAG: hypothetical protein ACC682_10485 [Gemmatimonadota bacterium]